MIELFHTQQTNLPEEDRVICDPSLDVLSRFCNYLRSVKEPPKETFSAAVLFSHLDDFSQDGNTIFLFYLIELAIAAFCNGDSATALLRVRSYSQHHAASTARSKLCSELVNETVDFGLKVLQHAPDEMYDAALMFNLLELADTTVNRPELNDLPCGKQSLKSDDVAETV